MSARSGAVRGNLQTLQRKWLLISRGTPEECVFG